MAKLFLRWRRNMVDISAISGGLTALKAAKDIAETLINLRDTAKFQAAVVELQGKILAAQSDQFTLLERVRELEAKMAQLEAWEAEKKRYALTEVSPGRFAYVLKPDATNSEPPHCICAHCYQKGIKSILQYWNRGHNGRDNYRCHSCDYLIEITDRGLRLSR
jgi:hypothetical protein